MTLVVVVMKYLLVQFVEGLLCHHQRKEADKLDALIEHH